MIIKKTAKKNKGGFKKKNYIKELDVREGGRDSGFKIQGRDDHTDPPQLYHIHLEKLHRNDQS